MKNTRVFISSITSVVLIATCVGFFITFQTTPQIAFARIFIDVGMLIALLSVCLTIPKAAQAKVRDVANALDDLARENYSRRLPEDLDSPEMATVSKSFNDLAVKMKALNEQIKSPVESLSSLPPASPFGQHDDESIKHSHHPELGPVNTVSENIAAIAEAPKEEELQEVSEASPEPQAEAVKDQTSHITETPHNAQDLRALYEEYCEALRLKQHDTVEFDEFKSTIEESVSALKETHTCQDVHFKVVSEAERVALRPHLVR